MTTATFFPPNLEEDELADPYQNYCKIVYHPAIQFKLRVIPAKNSNSGKEQGIGRKEKGTTASSTASSSSSSSFLSSIKRSKG